MSQADPPDAGNPYRAPQHAPEPARPTIAPGDGAEEVIQTIIPTRNVAALVGYYLGLSCLPVLGLPMAIAGVILGWKGLQKVRREPAAHGTIHAWIGLICGFIGLLLNTLIVGSIVLALIGVAMEKR